MNEWTLVPIVLVGGYYITTLVPWFSHWFAHLPRSPLRGFRAAGIELQPITLTTG